MEFAPSETVVLHPLRFVDPVRRGVPERALARAAAIAAVVAGVAAGSLSPVRGRRGRARDYLESWRRLNRDPPSARGR